MSAPKTVTKVLKNGVQYTSNVDKASYTLRELSRGALRDVGKYCKKQFNIAFYEHFNKRTGKGGKVIKAVVYSNEKTLYPRLEIGLKKGKNPSFYGMFEELGASTHPRLALLQHAVEDNVAQIIEIESQYLSALEDEARALALAQKIGEDDIEIDEE